MTARHVPVMANAAPRERWPEQSMMSGMGSPGQHIRRPARSQTRLGLNALIMAAGVLVISIADAAGRAGSSSAIWVIAYWLGELLVFAPAAWRLMSRTGPAESEAVGLAMGVALATYVVKYLYSPAYFGFPDELQQWRTVSNLLASHHLFGTNYSLPVSAVYPGLQDVTGSLATTTGLSVFAAGLIVAGLAHLLLTAGLYVVFRRVSGSPRAAVAACVFYAANPHYQSFDAIFGYQTLALGFFGLTLVAALELGGRRRGRSGLARWWVLGVVFTAATVVTHHVTSYVLVGALTLVAVAGTAARFRRGDRRPSLHWSGVARLAVLAEVCIALIVLWVGFVAPVTRSYLSPAARDFLHGFAAAFSAHAASTGAIPQGPLADQLAGYAAAALIMIGLPLGWRHIWRTHRHHMWALALAAGAASYYVIALLRFTTPDGAELSGRSLTFAYIPVSYTLAMALAWARQEAPRWRRPIARAYAPAVLAAVVSLTLVWGGLASGWPPYWERLPGHYVADGFESGITTDGIAAARWTRGVIGPGHRIAADFTNNGLLGSYGDQDPVMGVDRLYCGGAQWTAADAALAAGQDVQYLMVDLRTSAYAPDPRGYFGDSSTACPLTPIPAQNLQKFASIYGANRIYDSGNIIIYALPGGQNAP